MRSESEIRARIEELKEKMKAIKAEARREVWGEPNYKNHLIYGGLMKDVMVCYHDVAVLLWVLDEPLTPEIDLLTRLDPADEDRARLIWKRRGKRGHEQRNPKDITVQRIQTKKISLEALAARIYGLSWICGVRWPIRRR